VLNYISIIQVCLLCSVITNYRTGKRTLLGALKDGYNSAIRYYYNNFQDGHRQVCNINMSEKPSESS
jgi:hypothetical protein